MVVRGATVRMARLLAGDGLEPTVELTCQADGLCWTIEGKGGCSER